MDSPTPTPIPPPAAQEMTLEAQRRLDKVNPHLLRVTTEVQKMMMFHQYAAPVLAALAGGGEPPEKAATEAAKYADAMMELVRVRDAASHAQAAEHFDVTPQAMAPTPQDTQRAIAAAVEPLPAPVPEDLERPVGRLLNFLGAVASRAEALPGGEELYNFTKWLNDELIRVSEEAREDDRHERRRTDVVFEHFGHVYSLLSLVRHRHLPVTASLEGLKRDIDTALAPAERLLQPWWNRKR